MEDAAEPVAAEVADDRIALGLDISLDGVADIADMHARRDHLDAELHRLVTNGLPEAKVAVQNQNTRLLPHHRKLTVRVNGGEAGELTQTLGDLARSNEMLYTGEYPRESAMLHRVVFAEHYETSFDLEADGPSDRDSWYYARVVQTNEQMAWSTPIWVNRER